MINNSNFSHNTASSEGGVFCILLSKNHLNVLSKYQAIIIGGTIYASESKVNSTVMQHIYYYNIVGIPVCSIMRYYGQYMLCMSYRNSMLGTIVLECVSMATLDCAHGTINLTNHDYFTYFTINGKVGKVSIVGTGMFTYEIIFQLICYA